MLSRSSLIQAVVARTIVIGFVTAAITVPVAYVLAYVMRFVFTTRGRLLLDIVLISMFSGYLVRIYAWRAILGSNGVLNTALIESGLISEPITFLIYNLRRSATGRAMLAVRSSDVAARTSGITPGRAKISLFAFSAGWPRDPATGPVRTSQGRR